MGSPPPTLPGGDYVGDRPSAPPLPNHQPYFPYGPLLQERPSTTRSQSGRSKSGRSQSGRSLHHLLSNQQAQFGISQHAQAGSNAGVEAKKALSRRLCRLWTAVFVLILVAIAYISAVVAQGTKQSRKENVAAPACTGACEDTVRLSLQGNNMKAQAMAAAVDLFNSGPANNTLPSGKRVVVDMTILFTSPLNASLQPIMFTPATYFWVQAAGLTSSAAQCLELTSVPVGLAMWRKMATALGWPSKPISFKQLIELAHDLDGWASLGPKYASWGRLKLGHGHLLMSNSGRYGILAAIYSIIANQTVPQAVKFGNDTIWDPDVREGVSSLEMHTYHLGRSDMDLLLLMLERGQGYLHAIMTYEATVIDFNKKYAAELQSKFGDDVVLIYPRQRPLQPLPFPLEESPGSSDRQVGWFKKLSLPLPVHYLWAGRPTSAPPQERFRTSWVLWGCM
eukprot:jgi/Botrbrau1/13745/Bobra.0056s0002.1